MPQTLLFMQRLSHRQAFYTPRPRKASIPAMYGLVSPLDEQAPLRVCVPSVAIARVSFSVLKKIIKYLLSLDEASETSSIPFKKTPPPPVFRLATKHKACQKTSSTTPSSLTTTATLERFFKTMIVAARPWENQKRWPVQLQHPLKLTCT